VTLSVLDSYIPLSTLFSNTLTSCYSLNVRDRVSHPYKSTGRFILNFNFLVVGVVKVVVWLLEAR
jgi:hypothetical protein